MGDQELDAIRKQRLAQMENQYVSCLHSNLWYESSKL